MGGKPGPVPVDSLNKPDFTVLVAMGKNAADDRFYVVPTRIIWEALEAARVAFDVSPENSSRLR
jgi:hypothetical protein